MKSFLILTLTYVVLGSLEAGLQSVPTGRSHLLRRDKVAEYIPPSRQAPDGGYPDGTRFHEQPIHNIYG
ncbi:MAG: hypothetical protein F6K42_08255 [Leptolyngbya sp. SIO1D8]|nr:hypothetical protein [Leptolyngbya sp. SIO1D8]